ncbi:MAG: acyl-CoA dehydrogenase family protein, partial [Nitrososphaerales archaeon]
IASSNNQELKSALLPKLDSGSLGAFVIDPKSTIKSSFEGSQIVLNGSTQYVANADAAGVFLILAKMKDGSKSFVCFTKEQDEEIPGFVVSAPEKLLGMRAAGTARVEFLNFPLPKNAILFDDNEVSAAMHRILTRSRLAVAGQALGIGQAALDAEISYANERSQFNTKIGKFYAVQDFIAADHISIETARVIAYKASRQINDSHTLERDSAVAKVSSSNAAVQTARHSIRIHGGYGFIRDYPVERYLRDARVTQSYIESNEALKAKIAESLLGTPN